MNRMVTVAAVLLLFASIPDRLVAQFDEEADLIPGLVGKYTAGGTTVENIDVTLSHDWGRAAPDERLPEGRFSAEWKSQLLLREETAYTFHAYLQGAVSVEVDGEQVLAGETASPGWISGEPVELSFGLWELTVEFRKTEADAQVHLFWSSDSFPLEPIPPHLLLREEGRPDLAERELGRQLYAAHRCNRCHQRDDEPLSPSAPSLKHVTAGLQKEWLYDKLLNRNPSAAHARMPSFGFTPDEAADVGAYLQSVAEPVQLPTLAASPSDKKDRPDGELLVKSVGCLACHTVGDLGQQTAFGGGDLSAVGAKRSPEWLQQWLSDPETLNQDHRMPLVKLTDIERGQIVRELASWKPANRRGVEQKNGPSREGQRPDAVRRGRVLVERSRCIACHRIPGQQPHVEEVPSLEAETLAWERSCLSSADTANGRPHYSQFDDQEAAAIQSYVASRKTPLSQPSEWAKGRNVLEERNCLGCHERDLGSGIVPLAGKLEQSDDRFRGQSQALIPPSLTAVGDKLHDRALTIAVRGDQKEPRLPWLQVRMPRFGHSPEEQASLVEYLVGHDRIPEGAPRAAIQSTVTDIADGEAEAANAEQVLLTGHALAGAGGFNCVACHKFGEYEPRNVALGTKGCDLLMIQDRMREQFFHRWTRAPLRVVPGMEMPNFNKPVAGVLGEDVDRQLASVWQAINDPRFTAPTNPTQVEQLLVVSPSDEPRIVRDVFTVAESNGGGYAARPFAVGFGNGHSLLLDLDRFCIRGWTLGDFARQRTEGKSWYWDLAGVDVSTGFDNRAELLLRNKKSGEIVEPLKKEERVAELIRYSSDQNIVRLEQSLSFLLDGHTLPVTVTQELSAQTEDAGTMSGVMRTLRTSAIPQGWDLILRKPALTSVVGEAAISADADLCEARRSGSSSTDEPETMSGWIVPRTADGALIRQTFHCKASRPSTVPKPRPESPQIDATVTTLPGMVGERLPLPSSRMPTSITLMADGTLAFTSLKGDVAAIEDTDGDGLPETLTQLEEGLAAPFGILPFRDGLLVCHKPELLWLKGAADGGISQDREVWADGWGYSDDYHDWTTGPVQDNAGNLYLGIGSNYSQQGRSKESSRWRGKVLQIDTGGNVSPFAHELRYPQGIAIDPQGRLFVSDQQGVANTFNEINHVREGNHYGVKSLYDEQTEQPETRASVQIPHPWTRSVNGIFFLPEDMQGPLASFAGHGVGCEYNSKLLVRFSLQDVGGELQGACYYFSRPNWASEDQTFLGPICGTATATGQLYIGSIFDSGWLGGPNTGEIVRLTPNGDDVPNGIRELRATSDGFEIEFLGPVGSSAAVDPSNYVLSGYTRVWQGSYATPDSGRYTPRIENILLSPDRRTVRLTVNELREQYVYEVNCSAISPETEELFPATGHYTMNRIPATGE